MSSASQETVATTHLARLGDYLGSSGLESYLTELEKEPHPIRDLESAVRNEPFFRTKHWASVHELGLFRIILFVLTRAMRPNVFVETGVLHGITTLFILDAIERNGSGRLISIDLPSYFEDGPANRDGYDDTLPAGREPGWVVPGRPRSRWELRLGRSVEVLPELFEGTAPIDAFLHDSEHTYETMTAELDLAWTALRPGGFLVCDNIEANSAFNDFCARVKRDPLLFPEGLSDPDPAAPWRFGLLLNS